MKTGPTKITSLRPKKDVLQIMTVLGFILLVSGTTGPLAVASGASAADGVKIDKVTDHYVITTEVYTAQVAADGALSSLVIAGVEFMAPTTEIVSPGDGQKCTIRSIYACPMNNWYRPCKLPGAVELRDGVLHAAGNGWTLNYTFQRDAIEFSYSGTPEGCRWVNNGTWDRSFRAGYPPSEIVLSFAPDLDRACDPQNQGEFGWPIKRNQEPGNFAILAKNGAGLIAEDASFFYNQPVLIDPRFITPAPHRLVLLEFNTFDPAPKPVTHRLKLFKKADLAHSLTMEITSPNPNHLFTGTNEVVFPVKVTALYGQTLHGKLVFDGSPFVWQTPKATGEVPLDLTPENPTATVQLPIRPPDPRPDAVRLWPVRLVCARGGDF